MSIQQSVNQLVSSVSQIATVKKHFQTQKEIAEAPEKARKAAYEEERNRLTGFTKAAHSKIGNLSLDTAATQDTAQVETAYEMLGQVQDSYRQLAEIDPEHAKGYYSHIENYRRLELGLADLIQNRQQMQQNRNMILEGTSQPISKKEQNQKPITPKEVIKNDTK